MAHEVSSHGRDEDKSSFSIGRFFSRFSSCYALSRFQEEIILGQRERRKSQRREEGDAMMSLEEREGTNRNTDMHENNRITSIIGSRIEGIRAHLQMHTRQKTSSTFGSSLVQFNWYVKYHNEYFLWVKMLHNAKQVDISRENVMHLTREKYLLRYKDESNIFLFRKRDSSSHCLHSICKTSKLIIVQVRLIQVRIQSLLHLHSTL